MTKLQTRTKFVGVRRALWDAIKVKVEDQVRVRGFRGVARVEEVEGRALIVKYPNKEWSMVCGKGEISQVWAYTNEE